MSLRIDHLNHTSKAKTAALLIEGNSTLVTGSLAANCVDTKKPRLVTQFSTSSGTPPNTAQIQFDLDDANDVAPSVSVIAIINHNLVSGDELFIWGFSGDAAFNAFLTDSDPHSNRPTAGGAAATWGVSGTANMGGFTLNEANPTDNTGSEVAASGTITVRNTDAPNDTSGVNSGIMSRAIVYFSSAVTTRYVLIQVRNETSTTTDLEIGSVWIGNYKSKSPTGSRSAQNLNWQEIWGDTSDQVPLFNVTGGEARIAPRFVAYALAFNNFTIVNTDLFKDIFSTAGLTEPILVGPLAEGAQIDKRDFIIGKIARPVQFIHGVNDSGTFNMTIQEIT